MRNKSQVRLIKAVILALAGLSAWLPLRLESACTLTGATIQYAGDNNITVYLNGNLLVNCSGTCWTPILTHTLSAAERAWINPIGDNVLATQDFTSAPPQGQTWLLTLNYSNCPTQYVKSDGSCTYCLNDPSFTLPPGWNTNGFVETGWTAPVVESNVYSDPLCPNCQHWSVIPNPTGGGWLPWIWSVGVMNGDPQGALFRQHFQLGTNACLNPIVMEKSVDRTTAVAGNTVNYTLVVTNSSNVVTLNNLIIWDTLPAGCSYSSSTPPFSSSAGQLYFWNVGTLGPLASATVTLSVIANTGTSGEVKHNTTSGNSSAYSATQSYDAPFTFVVPGGVQKTASLPVAGVGQTETYTLSYPAPAGPALDTTSHLDLQVEGGNIDANHLDFKFKIINNSAGPVNFGGMQICYWVDEAILPNVITALDSGKGHDQSGPVYFLGSAWTLTTTLMPSPIFLPDGRVAREQICWTYTGSESVPAGDSIFDIEQVPLAFGPTWDMGKLATSYYSRRPANEAAYVEDSHFVLNYNSKQVVEYTNPTTQDPLTGLAPDQWVQMWDTVPAGITFVGATAPYTQVGNLVSWMVPALPGQNASVQFWGTVNPAANGTHIDNQSSYQDPYAPGLSNPCDVVVGNAVTNTFTPTSTPTPTSTGTRTSTQVPGSPTDSPTTGPSPSFTLTFTNSPTKTVTPTLPPTATATTCFTVTPTPVPVVELQIMGVYPNPVPPEGCTFVMTVPYAGPVDYKIYSLRGELVFADTHNYPGRGVYEYPWSVKNTAGAPVSFGAYYLRVTGHPNNSTETVGRWITVVR